jgi:SOS-response transcriptional repressor LexA
MLKSSKTLKKQAKSNDAQMFETSIFPKEFDKIAQSCYIEQMDAFSKLFEDEQFYKRVMGEMAKAMYLNYRNSEIGESVSQMKMAAEPDSANLIPLYTLRAACGYFVDGEMAENEGYIDASGLGFKPDRERHFAIHAKGHSMEPKIKDGDICVFEWYKGGSREGDIVLTGCPDVDPDTGCRYTIKKYHSEKVGADGSWEHSKVELKPLNSDYESIVLNDVDGYRTIGVFKGVIKL